MSRRGSVYLIEQPGLLAIPTQNMPEAKWLDLRRTGIGGSDIAAIMGQSPWRSPLAVYCDKVGLAPNQAPTEAMEFGTMMEPTLRKWAEQKLNSTYNGPSVLSVFSSPYMYRIEQQPIFLADVDGVVLMDEEEQVPWAGLELKTVDRYQAKQWADGEIPGHYRLQCNWYMGVLAMKRWVLGALIGKRFEVRILAFDPGSFSEQTIAAQRFWTENVEKRVMPEATGEDVGLLLDVFRDGSKDIIQAPELLETLAAYQEVSERLRMNEHARDELKAKIEQAIGGAKGLQAGGYIAIWSRFETHRVDASRLRELYPDAYAAVVKTAIQGRLSVKGSKGGEDE